LLFQIVFVPRLRAVPPAAEVADHCKQLRQKGEAQGQKALPRHPIRWLSIDS
jgi:hypothetical protein